MTGRHQAQQARARAGVFLLLAVLFVGSSAQTATDTVYVKLIFDGIAQQQFEAYNPAVLSTVASAGGVPDDYVFRVEGSALQQAPASSNKPNLLRTANTVASSNDVIASVPGPMTTGQDVLESGSVTVTTAVTKVSKTSKHGIRAFSAGRNLRGVQAVAEYGIKTNRTMGPWATPEVIRRKVLSSAAGFGQASAAGYGKGFYATLEKNRVPYQPQVFLDGVQILSGGLSNKAPKSRFGSRTNEPLKVLDPSELSPAGVIGNAHPVELRDAKLSEEVLTISESAPAQPQPVLQPWAIALIAVGGFFLLSLLSVFVWRMCVKREEDSSLPSRGSVEQFLARGSAERAEAGGSAV